jgi:hypothetical protein
LFVKLIFETPDVFEDWPKLFIRVMEKAIDFFDLTIETFELPEGPDSTLLPEPGLLSLLLSAGPEPPDLDVDESPFLVRTGATF